MPVLIVSTAPPARRSALPAGTRAGRALGILALLSLIATTSPLAAQSGRPLRRGPTRDTPRLLVGGYAPATASNRAAAAATVLAVQRRVPVVTLWVLPTRDVDTMVEPWRHDTITVMAMRDYWSFGRVLRAAHVLDVRATTRASQVELTGRLFRMAGEMAGDTLPVLVLTVTGTTFEAAADSLAAQVLRESDLLTVPPRSPQSGDPGDPRPSDRVLSAAPTAVARPRAQRISHEDDEHDRPAGVPTACLGVGGSAIGCTGTAR